MSHLQTYLPMFFLIVYRTCLLQGPRVRARKAIWKLAERRTGLGNF